MPLAVLSLACGSSGSPPASPDPGSGGTISITGRERIGWDQAADDPAQLSTLGYAIYVDGERSILADVVCDPSTGSSGYACSAKLPAMTNGIHALELVSILSDLESPRSAPIRVTVTGSTAGFDGTSGPYQTPEMLAEGTVLRIEMLATRIDRAVDAAFLPDGRLLVAERRGRVRLFANGSLAADDSMPPAMADEPNALLSIAVDPMFAQTRRVFIAEAAEAARGAVVQIVRYTELSGQLGQRAVIFQTAPGIDAAAAVLRFGPDGNLYLALDGETATGQVLRLTPDGATPRDGVSPLPAIAGGISRLRGMTWAPSGLLWIADEQAEAGSMSAIAMSPSPVRAHVVTRQSVQGHLGSLAFYTADLIAPMRGDALIASPDGHILRVHFAADDATRIARVDRLLENRVGAIRVVAVGPDGAIYFWTDDAMGRLRRSVEPGAARP
jgi:quinoprotein glucose dehydrogenase